MLIFLNGEFVSEAEATVSVMDGGLQYGYGVFETIRAYRGKPFRFAQHLDRLKRSAAVLDIPFLDEGIENKVLRLIAENTTGEAYVRITATSGPLRHFSRPPEGFSLIVRVTEPCLPPAQAYENGISCTISGACQDESSPLVPIKSLCFLPRLLVKKEAQKRGFDEAIMLNRRQQLTEASSSNLFFVMDGILRTPNLESGILQGITRAVVLEVCAHLGIPVREGAYSAQDMERATEAFLTNSISEILPIASLGGKPVGEGKPGKITKALAQGYREQISRES
ncbi:MAG: aminotransferase class IV [Armatimonadetes bacterium]|nr:aminotransferase class IV [Armatimonadota bacterium]